jgi:hypothetical protein
MFKRMFYYGYPTKHISYSRACQYRVKWMNVAITTATSIRTFVCCAFS